MARPPTIAQILSSKNASENPVTATNNGLKKPKFLSKAERINLVRSLHNRDSPHLVVENSAKREREEDDTSDVINEADDQKSTMFSKADRIQKKRSQFQFEWQEADDTMSDYRPIVETKAAALLSMNGRADSLADSYMGRHWSKKKLHEMNERDWRIFSEDFAIQTKGGDIAKPMRNWEELNLIPKDILDIITKDLRYKQPTSIQRVTIPNVCTRRNRDFLGVASTGSGKTLAFIVPILIKITKSQPRPISLKNVEGPKALILAPTRELAQQIQKEAQKLTSLLNMKNTSFSCTVISIVGGHALGEIAHQLSQGCDIIVATPGRLIDCFENHLFSTDEIETLVVDEADKMIDMGFEEQFTTILSRLNTSREFKARQTLMFTATMSPTIEKIANGYLSKPAYATIGGGEESIPQIQQIVQYVSSEDQRFEKIKRLLNSNEAPIIIFITYKKTADWLAQKFFEETSFKVTILHGSKSQGQREHSLQQLRNGKCQIMVATNVAARGLDIPNVSLVVNFQISKSLDDYVHRIGRTGRAGKKGTAVTFLGDDENIDIVRELYKYVEVNNPVKTNSFDKSLKTRYNLGNNNLDEIIY